MSDKVYCKNCKYIKRDLQDYCSSLCFHPSAKHRVEDKENDFYSPEEFSIAREYCRYKNSENDCEFYEKDSPLTLQMLINSFKNKLKFIRRVLKCRFARIKKIK